MEEDLTPRMDVEVVIKIEKTKGSCFTKLGYIYSIHNERYSGCLRKDGRV